MPYEKGTHPDCSTDQIAVLKSDDGKLMGCHDSEESANDQIAAIHANEGRFNEGDFNGSVIALFLPIDIAGDLAIEHEGAISADDLHITLAYFEQSDFDIEEKGIFDLVKEFAKSWNPVSVSISGTGRFNHESFDGLNAVYLSVDSAELQLLRASLVGALQDIGLEPSRSDYFVPHITLAYVDKDEQTPDIKSDSQELTFNTMTLAINGQRHNYDLNQERSMDGLNYIRAFPNASLIRADELLENSELPVPFIASTEGVKSDGLDLRAKDWDLSDYEQKYGVVLYGHDYRGQIALPIGLGKNARLESRQLHIDVHYDTDDKFAMRVRGKAIKGMMAGSVGWERRNGKNVLKEFSNVNIPTDFDSLPQIQRAGLRAMALDIEGALGDEDPLKDLVYQVKTMVIGELGRESTAEKEDEGELMEKPKKKEDGEKKEIKARAGAVLSKTNRDDLQEALALIQGVIARSEPQNDSEELPIRSEGGDSKENGENERGEEQDKKGDREGDDLPENMIGALESIRNLFENKE